MTERDWMRRALVTGGGGFLGGAIVDALLARGVEVTSVSRGAYPALEAKGVRCLRGDLADKDVSLDACEGQDVVFHVAAKAGVWGPREEYVRANVTATENVAGACVKQGVQRLIFTSSPSVVFDGGDHVNAGPFLPFPSRYLAHYPETKARAEQLVRTLHGTALETVALRPHLIFGPGDPHLVPRLLERADAGQLRIVGSGSNEVSLTYVDNAARAHLAAADALATGRPVGGRAYFVNNREPVNLWEWINRILTATGRPPITRRVPAAVAYAAGAVLERIHRARHGDSGEPRMTRFVARQLATTHTYDMTPFEGDTGYREEVDLAEATRRTTEALGATPTL